jgi:acetyl-CoA acetyltransferase
LKPLGRFVGTQVAGCAPDEMGISPIFAIPALFKYAGIELKDVDFFELNEAFASQSLYCIQKLGLDMEKVNPNGGAIAIGHPTGATGARQTATLFNELQSNDKEVGVISMCARYVCSSSGFPEKSTNCEEVRDLAWLHYLFENRIIEVQYPSSCYICECAFYEVDFP